MMFDSHESIKVLNKNHECSVCYQCYFNKCTVSYCNVGKQAIKFEFRFFKLNQLLNLERFSTKNLLMDLKREM